MRCPACDSVYEQKVKTFRVICGKIVIPSVKFSVLVCPKCQQDIAEVGIFIFNDNITIQGVLEE